MSKVNNVNANNSKINEGKAQEMAKEIAKVISPVQIDTGSNGKKVATESMKSSSQKISESKEKQKSVSKSLFTKIRNKMVADKKDVKTKLQDLSRDDSQKVKKGKLVV